MKLYFKQRLFSWFDSYDVYDEYGNTAYVVKGQLAWGHRLVIYNANGYELGMVEERIISLLPRFNIYQQGRQIGSISRELSFFRPRYNIDYKGWRVEGNMLEWHYTIVDYTGNVVAVISKQIFNLTDTYIIDVRNPEEALYVLMFVLAMDAEKCSRN